MEIKGKVVEVPRTGTLRWADDTMFTASDANALLAVVDAAEEYENAQEVAYIMERDERWIPQAERKYEAAIVIKEAALYDALRAAGR